MMRSACCLLLALALPAQTPFRREILPGGAGLRRLEVDMVLLGATRAALADLRLQDGAGREVPWFLAPPARGEAPWRPGRLLALPATKASSGFELDLGRPVLASRLRVEGLRGPFLKRYRLEGSGDRTRWTVLVAAGSLFDLPGEDLRLLQAELPAGEYRYLRLVWDDRSSAPLPMPAGASVQLPGPGGAPPRADLPFRRLPSEPGMSRFTVRLPGPRLPLRALALAVAGTGPLLRRARVMDARLRDGNLLPVELGSALLRRAERDGVSGAELRIPLEGPEGLDLELQVEDGDNPPLELTAVAGELAPQPILCFQSPGGAPLWARCGDPRLKAPAYDLEALRGRLDPAGLPAARWGAWASPPASGAEPAATPLPAEAGAVLVPGAFRHRRPVPDGAGLAVLTLDAHVLAHSRALADLRLLDGAGRQVPYLLERRDEPLELPLALPRGRAVARGTVYDLRLPLAHLPACRLVLETRAPVFQREVRVAEEAVGGRESVVREALWRHGDPGRPAAPLVLSLPALEGRALVLRVEEGDNAPLALTGARLLLPTCYGADLQAPRYDLALLADRLRLEPARELALAQGAPETDRTPVARGLFWGVLAVVMGGLLLLLARLLRHPGPDGA
jgi:hypothetical protein